MRRALPVLLLLAAVVALAMTGAGSSRPAGAATPTPSRTPSPTPTPTPPPPGSLPARFTGKLNLTNGFKAPGKVALATYLDANTKCVEGTVSSTSYAVNVPRGQDRPGCPGPGGTVYFKLGDYWAMETGTWVAGIPTPLDLTFPKMVSIALPSGCAQIATTYSNGTTVKMLIDNLTPSEALAAIWRWNGQDWEGFFPGAPTGLNSLKSVNRLDVLWFCSVSTTTHSQPSVTP